MNSISFFGASGVVTGSSFLLRNDFGTNLLVDLGIFQGTKEISEFNYKPLRFTPNILAGVVVTHAHLDHCGRLPLLVKDGFSGPIYLTKETEKLVKLVLIDEALIMRRDKDKKPMFTVDDVERLMKCFKVVDYNEPFRIGEFSIVLKNAGHILGSSTVVIMGQFGGESKTIVFSGDLGNTPQDLLQPTEIPDYADVVVMESTYGDRLHPKQDAGSIIQEEICTVERLGSTLLIPAFSLQRTQEVLHRIHHLKKENKIRPETPVYLDSPMAIKATFIYKKGIKRHSIELLVHERVGENPFSFPGLVISVKDVESRKIRNIVGPKVIIAGSGMMVGGRIIRHAQLYLPHKSNRLLIVGYQAEETLGREIIEGSKKVTIYGEAIQVNAHIRQVDMSAHADQVKLLNWLRSIKGVKHVFLVHGEDGARTVLADKISVKNVVTDIVLPRYGDELILC